MVTVQALSLTFYRDGIVQNMDDDDADAMMATVYDCGGLLRIHPKGPKDTIAVRRLCLGEYFGRCSYDDYVLGPLAESSSST